MRYLNNTMEYRDATYGYNSLSGTSVSDVQYKKRYIITPARIQYHASRIQNYASDQHFRLDVCML